MFGGFFKNMVKTADEVLISGVKVSVSIISLWVCFYYQHNRQAAVFWLVSWYASFFCYYYYYSFLFCRRLMSFLNRRRLFCWIIPVKSKMPLLRLRKWPVHTKVRPFHTNELSGCKHFGYLFRLRDINIHKKIVFLFLDVADDYNHISGALNSTAADNNNSAFKKWEVYYVLLAVKTALSKNSNTFLIH